MVNFKSLKKKQRLNKSYKKNKYYKKHKSSYKTRNRNRNKYLKKIIKGGDINTVCTFSKNGKTIGESTSYTGNCCKINNIYRKVNLNLCERFFNGQISNCNFCNNVDN